MLIVSISIQMPLLLTQTALSAFVDLYLAIYPAIVLWKLHMSTKKKLALMAALGLGTV
jgi:hypothetical protein